jgi:hypothetical protein
MAFKFTDSSSDLFRQASSSLSTDLKAIPESGFSIATDLSNPFNTNKYFQHSSNSPVAASVANNPNSNPPFTSGYYTVGKTGKVSFDYLFDGGAYEGELAIFNLEGMGQYQIGSNDFVREAVKRSLSNSTLGYVVISDLDEAARFSGDLKWDKNHNLGEYRGIKSFTMREGAQFAMIQLPNGKLPEVLNNTDFEGEKRPLFSLAPNNPLDAYHFGKFQDVNGGQIFGMEDLRDDGASDRDFNDFVFYMEGAVGNEPSLDDLINKSRDWRSADIGKKISEWKPIPENSGKSSEILPKDGDLVKGSDEKVYQIEAGKKRWISNSGLLRVLGFRNEDVKTFADEKLSNIPVGEKYSIPKEYQESTQSGRWNSEFYSWDGKDLPSLDFSSNKDNLFATINLDSNLAFPPGNVKYGIDLNWGSGSPKNDSKLLDDNFVIRSYTQANFNGGQYTAAVKADDGYQLFARNQATGKVVDITGQGKWSQDAYGQFKTIEFTPEAGTYDLYFQYFERTGDAYFSLIWEQKPADPIEEPPPYKLVKGSDEKVYSIEDGKRRLIPNPGIFQEMGFKNEDIKTLSDEELKKIPLGKILPIPQNYVESPEADKWYGKLYSWDGKDKPPLKFSENQENQFAALNLGSNTNGVKFDWGNGSFNNDTKLLSDNFAIAASKEVTFENGTYILNASGDDGFQIFAKKVGTNDIINITPKDNWTQAYNPGKPFKTEVPLNGKYDLYFNFYEQGGDAKFDLTWEKKVDIKPPIDPPIEPHKYEFTYFFNGENKEGSDYYTGWVIAEPGKGYKVGEYVDPNPGDNETAKNGRYQITSDVVVDAGKAGEVFVNSYYDIETKNDVIPIKFKREQPSGINYLGSEYDFIGSSQSTDYDFGLDRYAYNGISISKVYDEKDLDQKVAPGDKIKIEGSSITNEIEFYLGDTILSGVFSPASDSKFTAVLEVPYYLRGSNLSAGRYQIVTKSRNTTIKHEPYIDIVGSDLETVTNKIKEVESTVPKTLFTYDPYKVAQTLRRKIDIKYRQLAFEVSSGWASNTLKIIENANSTYAQGETLKGLADLGQNIEIAGMLIPVSHFLAALAYQFGNLVASVATDNSYAGDLGSVIGARYKPKDWAPAANLGDPLVDWDRAFNAKASWDQLDADILAHVVGNLVRTKNIKITEALGQVEKMQRSEVYEQFLMTEFGIGLSDLNDSVKSAYVKVRLSLTIDYFMSRYTPIAVSTLGYEFFVYYPEDTGTVVAKFLDGLYRRGIATIA